MKRHLFYIILFLQLGIVNEGYSQGLQFYGNERRISERSSFRVFSKEYIPAPTGKFSVSFEYAIHNIESPGYILYLKNADGEGAFNLTYVYDEETKGSFMFAQDGKQIYYTVRYADSKLQGKWMPISIDMDITNNQAKINIGGNKTILKDIGLKGKTFTPQPFFGMCNHILETASFSIRNLTISNGKETWQFPLNESQGEKVHDSRGKVIGHITNPIWLINHSYYWKPVFQSYSPTPSGFVFAPKKQKFYIYNQDSITTYDIYKQSSEQFPYTPESGSLPIRLGMNFINETQETIYAYELNSKETYIAEMNLESGNWKTIDKDAISLQLHHHCGLYRPEKHQLLFFGGYGNRKYYNTFITYDLLQSRWDTLAFSGDPIPPRFFAGIAMTADGKHAYIYGGKGNEAGDQNVGIQYYYDCYKLDFENKKIKKLWEHKAPKSQRIPTRDMILSDDENYIYLLAYPEYKPQTYLQLYRLSISDGKYEALGDSIPLTSEEIATNANLYYNPNLDEFYCVTQEFEKYGQSSTRIYSLSNPPVSLAAMKFYDEQTNNSNKPVTWFYLLIPLFIIASASVIIIIKRKRSIDHSKESSITSQDNPDANTEPTGAKLSSLTQIVDEEADEPLLSATIALRKSSISLFGTFTVIDKNGRDITYMFSPKIRHLFLYILINSITKDGVLSSDLNNLFWPDKPDDKIKNLKNVTINHLRKTLQELEGIELTHQKGYFKLAFTEECYCDYQRFFFLTGGIKQAPSTEDESAELHTILSHGKFLNTIETSLFDYSKQQAEAFTISVLSEQVHTYYKNGRNSVTIRICNILFDIDPLSDQAMTYAVCTYRRQSRSDKAMQLYNAFTKDYRKVMGEDYPIAFDEVDINNIRL